LAAGDNSESSEEAQLAASELEPETAAVSSEGQSTKQGKESPKNVKKEEIMDTPVAASPEKKASQSGNASRQQSSGASNVNLSKEGSLFGWLVNFSQDPTGVAREVRTGRFFVGCQRLRSSDMVISDDSISTPHALVNASFEEGLKVQDLMSEQGTMIRRANEPTYVQFTEPIEIFHGDWIKFGNYELMVCLLPLSN
ncbi:hypothetical protein BVY02_02280, partial [bacterium J17]